VTFKDGSEGSLTAMTFIDPASGWFEVAEVKGKKSVHISHLLHDTWLARYPRPERVIVDNGSEFKKDFRPLLRDLGIKLKPTTVRNPQANAVLERVHQVLGNMLRTKNIRELDLNPDDPWTEVLASVAWAIRSTYHTTLGATPAQLVYGRDMVYPLQYIAEWDIIRKRKQSLIDKSNTTENRKRVKHTYNVGDKILKTVDIIQRKLDNPTVGPFSITQVHNNGTVEIKKGVTRETVNIRRIKPFFE